MVTCREWSARKIVVLVRSLGWQQPRQSHHYVRTSEKESYVLTEGGADSDSPRTGNGRFIAGGIAVFALALLVGFLVGRMVETPAPTEFWRIAAQPLAVVGGGIAALIAASVSFRGLKLQVASSDRQFRETYNADVEQRKADNKNTDTDRCWARFVWLVNLYYGDAGNQPNTSPDVVVSMLTALYNEAERLDDALLVDGIQGFTEASVLDWDDSRE